MNARRLPHPPLDKRTRRTPFTSTPQSQQQAIQWYIFSRRLPIRLFQGGLTRACNLLPGACFESPRMGEQAGHLAENITYRGGAVTFCLGIVNKNIPPLLPECHSLQLP